MNEKTAMLHDLCRELTKELEEITEKISRAGGMSAGDLETVDKLSHALKSVKTTIAMMEAEEDGGYSGRYMMPYGRSYARGRMSAKRDRMGRYSRGYDYSYADGMEDLVNEMREILPGLTEEKRRKAERLINELSE